MAERGRHRRGARCALAVAIAAIGGPAAAQSAGANRSLFLTPTLSVTQTVTDSYRPVADDAEPRRAEAITTVSPGLRLSSRGGRVQGEVDYALVGVLHARDSASNQIQHRLSAGGRVELVPDHLDLALRASISRQPTSAFGEQSVDGSVTDRNQSELRSFSLQPGFRAVLGGAVGVQASVQYAQSDTDGTAGSRTGGASLSLGPAAGGRVIGWSITASRQASDYEDGRRTTTDRAVASVIVRPDAELQVSVRGGLERTDLATAERRRYENYGAGLLWTPTPRTRVSLDGDRRQFGNAHQVTLEHRFRRSVWRFTDSRSLNDGNASGGSAPAVRAYDLFFALFASQEPDPVARDLLVRSFLQRNGISPDALVGGGFVTNAVTVQRRQEFSLALSGLRTTWTAAAFQTRTERADTLSGATDDLSDGPLRQRGFSVGVSHRLTPASSLNLTASSQRSRSQDGTARNDLDSVALGWTTRLGRESALSLTLRHVVHDDTEQYTENALAATFTTRF